MSTGRGAQVLVGVGGLASRATLGLSENMKTLAIDTRELGGSCICVASPDTVKPGVMETRARVLEKWPLIVEGLEGSNRPLVVADLGTVVGCAAVLPLARFAVRGESGFILLMPSSLERERVFHSGVAYGKLRRWGHRLAVIDKDDLYSGLWELDVESLQRAADRRLKVLLERLLLPLFLGGRWPAGPALLSVRCGAKAPEYLVAEALLELKSRIVGSEAWSEEGVVVASKSTSAAELVAALHQGREAWSSPFTYHLEDMGENLVAAVAVAMGRSIYDGYDPLTALRPLEPEEAFDGAPAWGVAAPATVNGFEMR